MLGGTARTGALLCGLVGCGAHQYMSAMQNWGCDPGSYVGTSHGIQTDADCQTACDNDPGCYAWEQWYSGATYPTCSGSPSCWTYTICDGVWNTDCTRLFYRATVDNGNWKVGCGMSTSSCCQVSANGACFETMGYGGAGYDANSWCVAEWTYGGSTTLQGAGTTQASFDKIETYSTSTSTPHSGNFVGWSQSVAATGHLTFTSDGATQLSGVQICLPPSLPPTASPLPPTVSPLYPTVSPTSPPSLPPAHTPSAAVDCTSQEEVYTKCFTLQGSWTKTGSTSIAFDSPGSHGTSGEVHILSLGGATTRITRMATRDITGLGSKNADMLSVWM
eukprot:Hpha_TRINITY_DN15014_c3_g1::TRINITY_DN15014_c3_g1_i2::g.124458::m.124458